MVSFLIVYLKLIGGSFPLKIGGISIFSMFVCGLIFDNHLILRGITSEPVLFNVCITPAAILEAILLEPTEPPHNSSLASVSLNTSVMFYQCY